GAGAVGQFVTVVAVVERACETFAAVRRPAFGLDQFFHLVAPDRSVIGAAERPQIVQRAEDFADPAHVLLIGRGRRVARRRRGLLAGRLRGILLLGAGDGGRRAGLRRGRGLLCRRRWGRRAARAALLLALLLAQEFERRLGVGWNGRGQRRGKQQRKHKAHDHAVTP